MIFCNFWRSKICTCFKLNDDLENFCWAHYFSDLLISPIWYLLGWKNILFMSDGRIVISDLWYFILRSSVISQVLVGHFEWCPIKLFYITQYLIGHFFNDIPWNYDISQEISSTIMNYVFCPKGLIWLKYTQNCCLSRYEIGKYITGVMRIWFGMGKSNYLHIG